MSFNPLKPEEPTVRIFKTMKPKEKKETTCKFCFGRGEYYTIHDERTHTCPECEGIGTTSKEAVPEKEPECKECQGKKRYWSVWHDKMVECSLCEEPSKLSCLIDISDSQYSEIVAQEVEDIQQFVSEAIDLKLRADTMTPKVTIDDEGNFSHGGIGG